MEGKAKPQLEEPQTNEDFMTVINAEGPFSASEIATWEQGQWGDYYHYARAFIERNGVAKFREDKDILRHIVETQILDEPCFGLGASRELAEQIGRHEERMRRENG
jgi:hypothetical protein